MAIDADPAVGLSTALGVDVKMTIDGIEVLSYIPDDRHLSMFDIQGENIFNLPEESPVVQGVRRALCRM